MTRRGPARECVMKKIESLTAEQTAQLAVYRDKWIGIGLSCEPLDVERAKDAVNRAYMAAGLKPPARFIICDSPLTGGLASVRASVRASVWASVRASVWDSVWASVRASVGASVGASVWASVRASVGASVGASVRASVWASVGASVRASGWASVRASGRASVNGSHDAHWLSIFDFYLSVLGLTEVERLRPLIDLAQCCGWWIPYKDVCILQHRHSELHRDDQGRLHNPGGMAVAYPDGWGLYAWHGLTVPESIIMQPPTASAVLGEANAEYKRVLIERMGAEALMAEIGAIVVSEDAFGRLWRADIGDSDPYLTVEVVNGTSNPDGTPKVYWLTVPYLNELRGRVPMATAQEAVAWSYGLRPEEYAPAIRT